MTTSWIKEAILGKTAGLPGNNSGVFSATLVLHLGDKLFCSKWQDNTPRLDKTPDTISRQTSLLLQSLCQAGVKQLLIHTQPENKLILRNTINSLPESITSMQQLDTLESLETDFTLCLAGNGAASALLRDHDDKPFVWVDWYGPFVMVVPFDGTNQGIIPIGGGDFFTNADSLLRELSHTSNSRAWQHILSGQLAVFLSVLYVTRMISQTGEFPWLLIDLENARFCHQQMESKKGIERLRSNKKIALEDFSWVNFFSEWR